MDYGFSVYRGRLEKYYGFDRHVVIPDGVREIGREAFKDRDMITSVVIPEGVNVIGDLAFCGCKNLVSVQFPHGVRLIGDGVFTYCEKLASIRLPESVEKIGSDAFYCCRALTSAAIPGRVRKIATGTFRFCSGLKAVKLPGGLTNIDPCAFYGCRALETVAIPDSVTEIGHSAFDGCIRLVSADVPESVIKIGEKAFSGCRGLADRDGFVEKRGMLFSYHGEDAEITIPERVRIIGPESFYYNKNLVSVTIPNGVMAIGEGAFGSCSSLKSVFISKSVTEIGNSAFEKCKSLETISIPENVTCIGEETFCCCENLATVFVPESVTEIENRAFEKCAKLTIVCREDSDTHRYCAKYDLPFLFDYQYEAFHGVIPPGIERLSSPFLADEEKPYIFISYSHKDRDEVLGMIKPLYESGWRIWYDEGLTIGDNYDETLERHIRECAAVLLFMTDHSVNSFYIRDNELPWAVEYNKPVIRCALQEGAEVELPGSAPAETVSPGEIENALNHIVGLEKGESRTARGIMVVFNPADRESPAGDGFACCLYAGKNAAAARAVLLEAKNSGCSLYDAAEEMDEEKLKSCSSLVFFLDRAFLADAGLVKILSDAFLEGRDLAVCQLEQIEADDLPPILQELYKMQWLNFVNGITGDMVTKLARHLQKRGCRNISVLPGFDYEKTEKGIVIKRYSGMDPEPRVESRYGNLPVTEISDFSFRNCINVKAVTIPDGVKTIGGCAFSGCVNLARICIPVTVAELGSSAFDGCESLESIVIPEGVTEIGDYTFNGCKNLQSVILPKTLRKIEACAFKNCERLKSIEIPEGVTKIGIYAFENCKELKTAVIPESVKEIGSGAFLHCENLTSVVIPEGVTVIESNTFAHCESLSSVTIPQSLTKIGSSAFEYCRELRTLTLPDNVREIDRSIFSFPYPLVICSPWSYARKYCNEKRIRTTEKESKRS